MAITVKYSSVEERDMDTLFLEVIGSDKDFLQIFVNKIESLKGQSFEVQSIELSKADNDGESDITVIIEGNGIKHGLLIEDKITAIPMEEQCSRYTKRGEKGIKRGDYKDFFVFIVSPQKYYDQDTEAKKYNHYVSYEECREYLKTKDEILYQIWVQQFDQAIEKAKKHSSTEFNVNANAFFKKYAEYQKKNYKELKLATNTETSNGYWPEFRTNVKNFYIIHKANFGYVDLTINGAGKNESDVKLLRKCLQSLGLSDLSVEITNKSAAIRIEVTKFNFTDPFSEKMYPIFDECFKAVHRLLELMDFIEVILKLSNQ